MYTSSAAALPATGMALTLWYPLAGVALMALGFGLLRAGGTFRRQTD
jgi:LPXTG-motif cell wall-anchored protein